MRSQGSAATGALGSKRLLCGSVIASPSKKSAHRNLCLHVLSPSRNRQRGPLLTRKTTAQPRIRAQNLLHLRQTVARRQDRVKVLLDGRSPTNRFQPFGA